jgi:hypothetical protein
MIDTKNDEACVKATKFIQNAILKPHASLHPSPLCDWAVFKMQTSAALLKQRPLGPLSQSFQAF